MFEGIRKIRIKGNSFFEDNIIDLFGNSKERYSFMYGSNGSGKSTISKAFGFIKNDYNEDFGSVELLDSDNNSIDLSVNDKNKVFIFNEDFVDKYVKIQPEGMSAIVMFGEQIAIDEKIKMQEEKLAQENKLYENELKKLEELNDYNSIKSPYYFHGVIESKIKDLWYLNDMKIRKLSKKSPYSEKIFEELENAQYKKNIKSEERKLKENLKFIDGVNDNTKTFNTISFFYEIDENYDSELNSLLIKKIDKPELTEREKKIFKIFTSSQSSMLYNAKEHFKSEKSDFCPYCFQNITKEYKDELLKNISKVLSDEIENYKNILNKKKLEELDTIDLNEYVELDAQLVSLINKNITDLNREVIKTNKLIDNKINNVYQDIKFKKTEIYNLFINLVDSINKLNETVLSFNSKIGDLKKIQDECKDLNTTITRNKLATDFDTYLKLKMELKITNEKVNKSKVQIDLIKADIDTLNAQKKNYTIAMKEINDDLKYIFMDNKRLYLGHEEEKYIIKSRGKKVAPNKVSAGERNAIALSYFFTTIKSNTNKAQEYTNDFFLVIDDPISSFDNDNKIGMYSFIRSKINKIKNGNENNKLLIMTHSIEAMYNFSSFENDFGKEGKTLFGYKELNNKQTISFKNTNNIYNTAFNKAFDFANGNDNSAKYEIGNILRKLLESFSTFECRCGFHELCRKPTIIDRIPIELRDYYENLMYRLFLNGESHFVNITYSIIETDFILNLTDDERIQVAKSLIVLMHIINDVHVEGQLQDNDKTSIIKSWKQELIEKQK